MARLGDEFLDEDAVIPEGGFRLVLRGLKAFAGLKVVPRDAHTLAAAAGAGLDHHGIADLVGDLHRLLRVRDQAHVARHGRNTCFGCDLFRGDLVAHRLDRARGRADEGHAQLVQRFGELHVLGQKAIARMDSFGAALLDRIHDLVDHDIAFRGRGRADMDRLIGHFHMQRVAVGIRVDGDSGDAHLAGGLDNAAGDLAPVGDQKLFEHGQRSLPSGAGPPFWCKTKRATGRVTHR